MVDGVVEGEEVAGPGVGQARHRLADAGLLGGGAGQVDAQPAVDVLDETGAVEARRRLAAPHVGHTEVLLGDVDRRRQAVGDPGRHITTAERRRRPHAVQLAGQYRAEGGALRREAGLDLVDAALDGGEAGDRRVPIGDAHFRQSHGRSHRVCLGAGW